MTSMGRIMASVAIVILLILEAFLASDMDSYTEPVLNGLLMMEETAVNYGRNLLPKGLRNRRRRMTEYLLFARNLNPEGQRLTMTDQLAFQYFNPDLDTKVIIHGFLDKVNIATWMFHMKDEFLLLDDYNVIIVDWSYGNFIPYSTAAANTEKVGEEISELVALLLDQHGARPENFHLIGHSMGAHIAGHVGQRIRDIGRITGLDPATYLFSDASPRSKLDRSDAKFVDAIHTDAGGIGMVETVGHVDFYPNGGEVQRGCTTSNSLRALLKDGVVEGVRHLICSHMRAPLLFTDTVNNRHCRMVAHACPSWTDFLPGSCVDCDNENKCAVLGYHVDTNKDYGSDMKYYLITSENSPYCGYEYKIILNTFVADRKSGRIFSSFSRNSSWSSTNVLQLFLYGSSGMVESKIENKNEEWQNTFVVFSQSFLGSIEGARVRWHRKPGARVIAIVAKAINREKPPPVIYSIGILPLKKINQPGRVIYEVCSNPLLSNEQNQQGTVFRSDYC